VQPAIHAILRLAIVPPSRSLSYHWFVGRLACLWLTRATQAQSGGLGNRYGEKPQWFLNIPGRLPSASDQDGVVTKTSRRLLDDVTHCLTEIFYPPLQWTSFRPRIQLAVSGS